MNGDSISRGCTLYCGSRTAPFFMVYNWGNMKILDVFGGKVRIAVSDKTDGNMRVFDEAERDEVLQNQEKFGAALGVDKLMTVRCSYDREDFARYVTDENAPESDGIVVARDDVGLILPLADCLGVVLYDARSGRMMLAHAGRHNLEQDGLVKAVQYLGGNPTDVRVFFSPVAGKENYKIEKLNEMGIAESALEQLVRAGVLAENIEEIGIDTTTDELYYSHSQGDKTKRFAIGAVLLAGDTRNLVDEYKGLSNEEVVAELDKKRVPLEIAIENLGHDFNIGTIVRNANAFNVAAVHVVGKRKYNRRGAMVTDRYLHMDHFESTAGFVEDARARGMKIVAIENNRPDAKPMAEAEVRDNCILCFGSESDGISDELLKSADEIYCIEQLGSTRSINVGCASSVAMYEWVRRLGYFKKENS